MRTRLIEINIQDRSKNKKLFLTRNRNKLKKDSKAR